MGLIMKNGIAYGGGSGSSGGGNANIVKLTQAEYDKLPESKYSDGILYAITDGSSSGSVGKPVELTRAQYEALGDSVLNDNILYAITDGDGLSAKGLAYDGSKTGLGDNVQEAIDNQNKNFEWKLVGSVTGSTEVSLPSDFNELLILVSVGSYKNTFTINIPYQFLDESIMDFTAGRPFAQNHSGGITIDVKCSVKKVYLNFAQTCGYTSEVYSEQKDSSTLKVYYR